MVNILIKGGLVYPMDSSRMVIKDGSVAVEDNKIVGVGKAEELESKICFDEVIDADGKAVYRVS